MLTDSKIILNPDKSVVGSGIFEVIPTKFRLFFQGLFNLHDLFGFS